MSCSTMHTSSWWPATIRPRSPTTPPRCAPGPIRPTDRSQSHALGRSAHVAAGPTSPLALLLRRRWLGRFSAGAGGMEEDPSHQGGGGGRGVTGDAINLLADQAGAQVFAAVDHTPAIAHLDPLEPRAARQA